MHVVIEGLELTLVDCDTILDIKNFILFYCRHYLKF